MNKIGKQQVLLKNNNDLVDASNLHQFFWNYKTRSVEVVSSEGINKNNTSYVDSDTQDNANTVSRKALEDYFVDQFENQTLELTHYPELMKEFDKLSLEDKLETISSLSSNLNLIRLTKDAIPDILSIMIYSIMDKKFQSAFAMAVYSNPLPQGDQICWRALIHALENVFFPPSYTTNQIVDIILNLLAGRKEYNDEPIDQKLLDQFQNILFTSNKSFLKQELQLNNSSSSNSSSTSCSQQEVMSFDQDSF